MTDPVFPHIDVRWNCWGCGEETYRGSNYTVSCPGCDPETPICEKLTDPLDPEELIHPELLEYRAMDGELLLEIERRLFTEDFAPCRS